MQKKLRISQILIMLAPTVITAIASILISGFNLNQIQLAKESGEFATPFMIAEAKAECSQALDEKLSEHARKNDTQFEKLYDRVNKIYDIMIDQKK